MAEISPPFAGKGSRFVILADKLMISNFVVPLFTPTTFIIVRLPLPEIPVPLFREIFTVARPF